MKRIISASLIAAALLAGPGRPAAWAWTAAEPEGASPPADQPTGSASGAPASGAAAAPAPQAQQQPAGQEPATPEGAAGGGPATRPAPSATSAHGAPALATAPAGPKASNVKQWLDTHKRSKKAAFFGALIGAGVGALGAAVRGQNVARGALVGAVVGGITGFVIGKNQDTIYAGRDRAVELAHYDPSQGYVMRVEEITCEPANAKPGESALLSVRYLVIGPDPHEAITVNYFRGIKYQEDYIFGDGPRSFVVPHGGGIVTTQVRVTIPEKAPAGTYAVEAMFEDPRGRFQQTRSSPLYIVS
jgi:hypothetical protein